MQTFTKLSEMRDAAARWRAGGALAVVPTMGALHAGHISLVEAAKARADRVVAWIFVNPKQFDNPEDLKKYPRHLEADAAKLAAAGVDALYAPDPDQVYPEGFATKVTVTGLTDMLCGAHRPGHFDGVATVVTKILTQTQADFAMFGEKDYQQLQVVSRLAADLNLPVEIVPCATVREADGLALSSRNERLSPEDRAIAPALHAAMRRAVERMQAGEAPGPVIERATQEIEKAGYREVEYLELRASDGLAAMTTLDRPARLFAAAHLGPVRLIDNIAVGPAVR
ncbi:pantoate--beta-alanine ligase [Maritimibacter sp. DP1N21-5]|uniref:pantoate--beta-alanine ligase n=1 Tax=Maritimibacter sp. DP1N21-5 TaxID=2836867 RepID=UPI001C45FAA8|nr:pantoate--beta-alanine ligase [Maritimibacter sp. DP1N21-5]MBV7409057.1 pantoate--beta-alanine ligase [Maritimibacter sp. DP1N21-5]